MPLKIKSKYIIAFIIMLAAAFIQCYRTVHDLHWASEPDFDRDIAYIRTTLNGEYGKDPNMTGQYMWYNPMLFLSETLAVKLTGLPINIVVARAGAFINIINPVAFFTVMVLLFDYQVALGALLAFIFLINGNLPCWGAPTYSPWMISDTFVQFLFYVNIYFCYKAFSTQKILWFAILGAGLGICFLGHTAPTMLVIFILISIQAQKVFSSLKQKQFNLTGNYFLQGLITLIPFVLCAYPFLYYVYGKYHFHFLNHEILECAPGVFARKRTFELLSLNVTFSLLIALIGGFWFYRYFENKILKKIIWNWLIISLVMYIYESAVPTVDHLFHVTLADTIPAFHYFFYLKALQAVFFGFGLIFLIQSAINCINAHTKKNTVLSHNLVIVCVLLYALVYYPIYLNRADFIELRQDALNKQNRKDDIEVYNFIEKHVPLNSVLLCPHGQSLFPAMPTGIKMVSIETYFSNPYVNYTKREADRNNMLIYLTTSAPTSAAYLFKQYGVNVILLDNKDFKNYKEPPFLNSKVIFKNGSYTILLVSNKSNLVSERFIERAGSKL